jgi:hypothetical protein
VAETKVVTFPHNLNVNGQGHILARMKINTSAAIRALVQLVCLTVALLLSLQACAAEPVKIGVLAFRPKPQTLAQWQPLADVLKRARRRRHPQVGRCGDVSSQRGWLQPDPFL